MCVRVYIYICKMKIQPANKILQQEKSKPNFTAECVGSLEACWWPSLAVCCKPGIAGALFPLLHSFSYLSAGMLGGCRAGEGEGCPAHVYPPCRGSETSGDEVWLLRLRSA